MQTPVCERGERFSALQNIREGKRENSIISIFWKGWGADFQVGEIKKKKEGEKDRIAVGTYQSGADELKKL